MSEDYLRRAGLIILIMITVVLSVAYVKGLADMQTPTEADGHIYRVTAYCPNKCCCGKWADGYTASGHKISKGNKFCAAPPEIPFGTTLSIPGYGRVPVLDRGGAIKGRRLDIYFDDHQTALNFGIKYLRIRE